MFWPLVYISAAPRAKVIMASVTMNGGVLKRVTMKPLTMLQAMPMPIPVSMAISSEPVAL